MNQGPVLAGASLDVFKGPIVNADLATRIKDFLVGGEVAYDVSTGKIEKYTASIAFDRPREKVVLQM